VFMLSLIADHANERFKCNVSDFKDPKTVIDWSTEESLPCLNCEISESQVNPYG
jgi:hypothetical protein